MTNDEHVGFRLTCRYDSGDLQGLWVDNRDGLIELSCNVEHSSAWIEHRIVRANAFLKIDGTGQFTGFQIDDGYFRAIRTRLTDSGIAIDRCECKPPIG